jgi:hypothetical protein
MRENSLNSISKYFGTAVTLLAHIRIVFSSTLGRRYREGVFFRSFSKYQVISIKTFSFQIYSNSLFTHPNIWRYIIWDMLSAGTLTYSDPGTFSCVIFIICSNCCYYYCQLASISAIGSYSWYVEIKFRIIVIIIIELKWIIIIIIIHIIYKCIYLTFRSYLL